MIYHSVAEIYEAMDDAHARFAERVGQLSDDAQARRDAPERWSIAEVVEHVATVESQIGKLAGIMLHKAASASPSGEGAAPASFAPVSIGDFVARSLTEKYRAPETALPRAGASISDSLARLERARETLRELRPRIEVADGTAVSYPHPAFGPLNLYQWLIMIAVHKDRHLRQIEAIEETMSAERGAAS
jgi:hypothetical protein